VERLAFLRTFAAERGLRYEARSPVDGLSDCSVYSPDMAYRYAFARWWDADGPLVLWVGVNPGKGDTEHRRRPTLERCVGWSREWGAGGLAFANLFAARHNTPAGLRGLADPVGPHNDAALVVLGEVAWRTVAAWGTGGRLLGRSRAVAPLLVAPVCLGVTASGEPRHPLYVPGGTAAVPWTGVPEAAEPGAAPDRGRKAGPGQVSCVVRRFSVVVADCFVGVDVGRKRGSHEQTCDNRG
jgi:hypothetical protein